MIQILSHGYTQKEKESLNTLFLSLSSAVCDYCALEGNDYGCPHKSCPYSHIIDDLHRVTKINKK